MTRALAVLNAMSVKIHLRAGQPRVGAKRPVVNFTNSMSMKTLVQSMHGKTRSLKFSFKPLELRNDAYTIRT